VRARPPVVVYVTREHPVTGTDEVLVFDYPDDPEYHAILPGGGIEAGETVEETARREVLEETGLEVRVIREVGVFDDSHFVQAAQIGPTAGRRCSNPIYPSGSREIPCSRSCR
jgi:8-oxo-dGTP pyrophosphatase MutT (NUDIX family)